MHISGTTLRSSLVLICFLLVISCSATQPKGATVLVGSTPGDEPVKTMLGIPATTGVDFIRWDLALKDDKTFYLQIVFGESQPNTLGFKGGGDKRSYQGSFTLKDDQRFKNIVQLNGNGLPSGLQIAKLNENIFHLLGPDQRLLTGNGGWSYTLNPKEPIAQNEILIASNLAGLTSPQMIFEGRTPCQEIAGEHPEMKVSPSCFKLKWLLTLQRDASSGQPTTYQLRKVVDNQPREIGGSWTIRKGTPANPGAVIYTLHTDKPGEAISLLAVDDQILLFLNAKDIPFVGNKDFSYTLNRRSVR